MWPLLGLTYPQSGAYRRRKKPDTRALFHNSLGRGCGEETRAWGGDWGHWWQHLLALAYIQLL
jgi:hypothetical protein